MGSDSRYEKYRKAASGEEAEDAHALHVVAALVVARPDAVHPDLRNALANVLDVTAVELNNGRSVTRPVRIAIRRLANDLQRHIRQSSDGASSSPIAGVEPGEA